MAEVPENIDITQVLLQLEALQEQVGGIYNEIADSIADLAKLEQELAKEQTGHHTPQDEVLYQHLSELGQMSVGSMDDYLASLPVKPNGRHGTSRNYRLSQRHRILRQLRESRYG